MKVNRATLVLPLAGLLAIAGAGAVLATSGDVATGGTDTVVPAAESPSPDTGTTMTPTMKDSALTDVLDDLVAKGTINESQKTAILDALAAERTARREARQAEREQIQGFLSDGVITQSEFDQLPEDSRIRQLEDLLSNGGITTDELRALRGFGGKGGHGGGKWFGGMDGTTPDAEASPSTSS